MCPSTITAPQSSPVVRYSITAETHVREAARCLELDPSEDAQHTAAMLYRLATRIRGSRGEVTVRW